MNWEELKAYFSIAELEGSADVRYKACIISEMLKDPINLLYFHFLTPAVSEFKKVNAYFQVTNLDAQSMMQLLKTLSDSFKGRLLDSDGEQLPLTREESAREQHR